MSNDELLRESCRQLKEAQLEFIDTFQQKWIKGQAEHGGLLTDRIGLVREIKDEILDQWAYMWALETQLKKVLNYLENADVDSAITLMRQVLK